MTEREMMENENIVIFIQYVLILLLFFHISYESFGSQQLLGNNARTSVPIYTKYRMQMPVCAHIRLYSSFVPHTDESGFT